MVFPQPAGPVTAKGSRVLCHSHQSLICAKNAGSKVWAASTGMVRESRESAVLRVVLRKAVLERATERTNAAAADTSVQKSPPEGFTGKCAAGYAAGRDGTCVREDGS